MTLIFYKMCRTVLETYASRNVLILNKSIIPIINKSRPFLNNPKYYDKCICE